MTIDELLMARIQNREQQALSELYDRYIGLLWKISFRSLADQAICEEVVSCVFESIWAEPERFSQGKNLPLTMIECCQAHIHARTLKMPC